MKSVVVNRMGRFKKAEVRDMPKPSRLADHEVLIRVKAAGINPIDYKIVQGKVQKIIRYKKPQILGLDVCGVVESVGSSVRSVKKGDEIIAMVNKRKLGSLAEFVAVGEQYLALKPKSWSWTEGASIPLAAITAWQSIVKRGNIKSGDKVLIHAGSGGVGSFAIQIAKSLGAFVATTTSKKNHDLVKSLGADIVIDYRKERFWKKISGYDIVLDCVGGRTEGKSMKILKPGGRQITISGFPDIATAKTMKKPPLFLLIMYLLNTKRQMRQKKYKVHFSFLLAKENGRDLSKIVDLADSGNIKPVIDRVFSIDDAPSAIEYVKTNRAKGKVVVEVGI